MDLQIVDQPDPAFTLIVLSGRLDTRGADAVETRFVAAATAGQRHAIVDLSKVEILTSMGIRMLLATARAMAGRQTRMVLFGAGDLVRDVLEIAAIDSLVPHAGDLAAARALLPA